MARKKNSLLYLLYPLYLFYPLIQPISNIAPLAHIILGVSSDHDMKRLVLAIVIRRVLGDSLLKTALPTDRNFGSCLSLHSLLSIASRTNDETDEAESGVCEKRSDSIEKYHRNHLQWLHIELMCNHFLGGFSVVLGFPLHARTCTGETH